LSFKFDPSRKYNSQLNNNNSISHWIFWVCVSFFCREPFYNCTISLTLLWNLIKTKMVLSCLTIFLIHSCDKHVHGPHKLCVPGTVPERHGSCLLGASLVQEDRQEFGKWTRRKGPFETREMACKVWNSMAFSGNNRWLGMTWT